MKKYSKKPPFPPCSSTPHKLKFLFISGGEFTGELRYVGGDTRLVSLERRGGITLSRLLSKLSDLHPITSSSVLKYQLLEPSRTPSPLVPIASDDELRRMVEEYDKLMAAAANGSASRLRVFLCEVKPRLNPNPTDPDLQKRILTIENGRARVSRLRKTVTSSTGDDSGFEGITCSNNCHLGKSSHLRRYYYGHDHMNNRENVVRSRAFLVRYQHPHIQHYKSRIHKMIGLNDFGYKNVKGGFPAIVMTRGKLNQDLPTCISPLPDFGTNSRYAIKSPSDDISMDQLSLASSAKASCRQLSYSSHRIDIPMKSEAHTPDVTVTSRSHYGQIHLDKGDQFGDIPTHQPVFVEGQVSVDRKNEAAYMRKDQRTKSSALSNLVEKKDDVMGGSSICFEENGKAGYDRLACFSHFADQDIQTINESDIEHIRELGSGAFGTVFYGKWKGSDVAIKRIKPGCFSGGELLEDKLVSDFWKEAHLLSQLHHPNVLAFYGMVTDAPMTSLATVTEYMVNGSLKQVLQRKDRTIDRRKRLIIAMDAAFGMEYLHDKKVVHFDLKSHNLLVNMKDPHRPVCKIGDLGLSKVKRRTLISGGVRGTIPWMAPELLNSENNMVTEKVDVYSFGIVMWELLTGEEPYQNICSEEIIAGILQGNLRPEIPSWCDPAWRSLMEWCWSSDPGSRPSFSKVAKELRTIAASINIK